CGDEQLEESGRRAGWAAAWAGQGAAAEAAAWAAAPSQEQGWAKRTAAMAAWAEAPLEGQSPSQGDVLRDIIGNPFRPAAFKDAWRTAAAVAIAQACYDTRDLAALPVLADALEKA